jgi:hypothetical protein
MFRRLRGPKDQRKPRIIEPKDTPWPAIRVLISRIHEDVERPSYALVKSVEAVEKWLEANGESGR